MLIAKQVAVAGAAHATGTQIKKNMARKRKEERSLGFSFLQMNLKFNCYFHNINTLSG